MQIFYIIIGALSGVVSNVEKHCIPNCKYQSVAFLGMSGCVTSVLVAV